MRKFYPTLLILAVVALSACRKERNDIDIKAYDQQQIEGYLKSNNLTNMKRDLTDGDTTGIYYEILSQPTKNLVPLDYSTQIAYVYSVKSLDGSYNSSDTIANHSYRFLGSTGVDLPKGLMLAIRNLAKYKGTRARFIIPSRLAFGQSGYGTGATRIKGNTSLEYYVNVLDDRQLAVYDEACIKTYATANGIDISTYTREASGLFWKRTQPDTGKVVVTPTSTVTTQYTGTYLNNIQFDNSSNASEAGTEFNVDGVVKGFGEGLQKIKAGGQISLFLPSGIAYGTGGRVDNGVVTVAPFQCLRFEVKLLTVKNN
ncbi:FKBP-type peptidyl-prolyl cis-trans isomerase [Mucilaginibacter aquatilis]|uniref:Peptidyl-prolyl cis-trans isomerase n=1 Tax=Mucilaginibacter aquatilis TaxID=1517760 RepID=A0A6I4I570_9SPHI|nr:FKBP-type peptidyl-prolyl cis-trans isomerase [Mucilaginibacter aquatilis]MVN90335.1 hypothetical protein [Mucilaginibacter aquatilis]